MASTTENSIRIDALNQEFQKHEANTVDASALTNAQKQLLLDELGSPAISISSPHAKQGYLVYGVKAGLWNNDWVFAEVLDNTQTLESHYRVIVRVTL